MKKSINRCDGFSLIELLITLAISSVVLVSIYQLFNSQSKDFSDKQARLHVIEDTRNGLDLIMKDMSQMRKKAGDSKLAWSVTLLDTTPGNSKLRFYFKDKDNNDNKVEGSLEVRAPTALTRELRYSRNALNAVMQHSVLCSSILGFTVTVFDKNGVKLTGTALTDPTTQVNTATGFATVAGVYAPRNFRTFEVAIIGLNPEVKEGYDNPDIATIVANGWVDPTLVADIKAANGGVFPYKTVIMRGKSSPRKLKDTL